MLAHSWPLLTDIQAQLATMDEGLTLLSFFSKDGCHCHAALD